jgi:hypothetical protein
VFGIMTLLVAAKAWVASWSPGHHGTDSRLDRLR